ncbi:MAG: phytase [Planctomycetota bacterium]|nr:phytase [Planctomycetota bacterium]
MDGLTTRRNPVLFAACALALATACHRGTASSAPVAEVGATVETDPVPTAGDGADDPCLWVHPEDPSQSLVIGTDKRAGLGVYDLSGRRLQLVVGAGYNNVDVRYGFSLGGEPADLVAAGDQSHRSIDIFRVDPRRRRLERVSSRRIEISFLPYGLCLYRSAVNGKFHVFVTSVSGAVEQWELFERPFARVDARRVRSLRLGGETEGCVADDLHGALYVAEERVGIWKYGAEPTAGTDRQMVDRCGQRGRLGSEVEGLAIYAASRGRGYLIASSQSKSEFVVYRREGDNDHVGNFRIVAAEDVDGVSETDGIEVSSASLGLRFPRGVFIAHDGANTDGHQNFKLVPWEAIASALELRVETGWDPRRPASAK